MMSPDEVLKKLESESRKVNIEGLEIEVHGLTFPELAHLAPHMDRKNTEYVLNYIAKKTLNKSFPKWDDKEINTFLEKVNPKHLVTIVSTVKEMSMPDDGKSKGDVEKKEKSPKRE